MPKAVAAIRDRGNNEPYSDTNAPGSLERTQLASHVPPLAGRSVEYTQDSKSLDMVAPDGTVTRIGPTPGGPEGSLNKRVMAWNVNYAAAAAAVVVSAVGAAAATVQITATTQPLVDGNYANQATSAVVNNASGMNTPIVALFSHQPDLYCRFRTGPVAADIATVRLWVCLTNGAIATQNQSATPAASYAGFRYDTVADATMFWRCVTGNSATLLTVTVTTVPIAADTIYFLSIITTPAAVRFYINGVLVATHTTNLPSAITSLTGQVQVTTLTAGAKSARWSRLEIRSQ